MGKLNINGIETTDENAIKMESQTFIRNYSTIKMTLRLTGTFSRKCSLFNSSIKMAYIHPLP
jgi:hypothetical protein